MLSFLPSLSQKITSHVEITIKDAPPSESWIHHRRTVANKLSSWRLPSPSPQKITSRSRSKMKQHPTRNEKTRTQTFVLSLSLSHFLKRCSSYPRYSADIPGNHVSRRDYGVKNKGGTRRGRRRGKGGTKRSNASLMTVRKFQREWIIHGGKQKGVEVVSDRAMHRGLNRYNASCTSACVIIFLSLLQQTGWKLG